MNRDTLGLGQRLGMRLRPLALATGLLISLGLPATYYALEFGSLGRDGDRHAQDFAGRLRARLDAEPRDAGAMRGRIQTVLGEFAAARSIAAIRLVDRDGRELDGYRQPGASGWWDLRPPAGRVTLGADPDAPRLEVAMSQRGLLGVTAALLALSTAVGGAIASLVYFYPVRVVRRAEVQVEDVLARQDGLLEASRLLASTLDLREVLDRLTEIARSLPGIDVVRIWLRDDATGGILCHSQAGMQRLDVEQQIHPGAGRGLTAAVVEGGRPVVLRDTLADPRLVNTEWFRAEGLVSYLGVPLKVGDDCVGALACMSREPRDWTRAEIALSETLGSLAAVAIRNARLFGESETRRRAAEAIAEVGRVLAQALDAEVVGQRVADSLSTLLGTTSSAVFRLDPDSEDLIAIAVSGKAAPVLGRGVRFPRGMGVAALAVSARRPVATSDILNDPRVTLTPELHARITQSGYAAVLVVPLVIQGRVIGALSAGDRAGRVFTPDEIQLAQTFADQAALALENARLYAEATRRRHEAEELARVARSLTETLDVSHVGRRIVESVLPLFAVQSSGLFLVQPDRSLRAVAWGGGSGAAFPADQVFPAGIAAIGRVATSGGAVRSRDMLADPEIAFTDDLREKFRAAGNRAVLSVPLHAKGELVGVLSIADRTGRDFTDAELALLQTFGDQAALALENARLYENAQRAYQELSQTQAQLVRGETLRAMGELASGVAHHLNNLLAVVLGRLQLARSRQPSAPLDRHLELAERAALDGAEVVRRMRGFSRGHPSPDLTPVDLNRIADEVLELTRPRWQDEAQVRGVRIEARLDAGDIPEVAGEVAALREVLMNLILNAVDALPAGGTITVRTWVADGAVHCQVADDGIGMTPDVQRRALEPFFTTKGFQSTGLGLSVNYGIIRRHGGELTIDSGPGEGTRVTFQLPLTRPVAAPLREELPPVTSPLRILVVDDEWEVRAVVAEILAAQGHDVVQAAGGVEGLAWLDRESTFDLVLTDLGMPGMTGWEVARAAKARRPSVRVGLLTGWGEQPIAKPEERAAADFVLAKPVTVDGLRAALATVRPAQR